LLGGIPLKKVLLGLLLLLNLFFIVYFLSDKGIIFSHKISMYLWGAYLVAGLIYSIPFIIRYKKNSNLNIFLSFGVLTTSLCSLGVIVFFYSLFRTIGG